MQNPLWMPPGSVRSLIALGVVGAYVIGWITELEIVTLVLGFYFGTREHTHHEPVPNPE